MTGVTQATSRGTNVHLSNVHWVLRDIRLVWKQKRGGGGKKAWKGGREVAKAKNLGGEQSARLKSASLSPFDILLRSWRAPNPQPNLRSPRLSRANSEDAMEGWKKRGGGKPHE